MIFQMHIMHFFICHTRKGQLKKGKENKEKYALNYKQNNKNNTPKS